MTGIKKDHSVKFVFVVKGMHLCFMKAYHKHINNNITFLIYFNNSHAVPPFESNFACPYILFEPLPSLGHELSSCNFLRFKPAHQIYSAYVSNCKFCRKKVINNVRWLGLLVAWSIGGTTFNRQLALI